MVSGMDTGTECTLGHGAAITVGADARAAGANGDGDVAHASTGDADKGGVRFAPSADIVVVAPIVAVVAEDAALTTKAGE